MPKLEYIENPGTFWDGKAINGVKHPRTIGSAWSVEELEAIGLRVYEPPEVEQEEPSADPVDYPLTKYQIMTQLELAGYAGAVQTAIDGIADATQRTIAQNKFLYTNEYRRDDPLVTLLAGSIGLTDEQVDTLWMAAKDLT